MRFQLLAGKKSPGRSRHRARQRQRPRPRSRPRGVEHPSHAGRGRSARLLRPEPRLHLPQQIHPPCRAGTRNCASCFGLGMDLNWGHDFCMAIRVRQPFLRYPCEPMSCRCCPACGQFAWHALLCPCDEYLFEPCCGQ